jgi:L-xylulokinase
MKQYLLGLDIGGTMTKAAIYNLKGEEIAVTGCQTPCIMPREGYVQRDMALLWDLCAQVIREVIQKARIQSGDILGIGCTGHGKGLYLWGKNNRPAYDGIASTDHRADVYADRWAQNGIGEKAKEKTFHYPIGCQPVCLLAWMKDHEPEVYDNIQWIFEAKDYIRFMLTGQAFAERTDTSGTCLLNLLTRDYDRDLLTLFGIQEIYPALPPLIDSTDFGGSVSAKTALKTGLSEGTVVCGGMFDIDACAIAMGIIDESKLCVITGTWSINEYISPEPVLSVSSTKNSIFAIPEYYLIEESSPTSVGNLDVFVRQFTRQGDTDKRDSTPIDYKVIDAMVEAISPEESSVLFFPFLYGTNIPALHHATLLGFTASHHIGHLYRAVFEGVVFSHYDHIIQLLKGRKLPPDVIRLAGGGANSEVWVRMFCDMIGKPIEVLDIRELGALGCSMAAAVCSSVYADYKEAVHNMVCIKKRYEPDLTRHNRYLEKFAVYQTAASLLSQLNQ